MAFQKKTWVDRLAEFPGRRLLKIISQSSTEIVADVFRNEGNISREGDPYNALNMNDLETRIADEFSQLYSVILNIPEAYIDRDCVFTCNASGGTSKGTASETEYFSISSALKITIKRKFLLYISVYSNYAKNTGAGLWENIDAGESILINGITVTSSTKTSDILIPVNPDDVITFKCYSNSNTSTNDAILYMLPLFCTNRN